LTDREHFRIFRTPELASSSLVVAWSQDAGALGPNVIDYLNDKLRGEVFGEIEPSGFFPLGGVSVENDVARFPECSFRYCRERNLVFLKSSPPGSEWYSFLSSILDVAEQYAHVREVYAIGGMVSIAAHTTPRQLLTVANSPAMKDILRQDGVSSDMDYETPPGQRPTLSSYLLWLARGRGIAGASIWVPVPFYFVTSRDPQAWKKALDFLDSRLELGLDLKDIDEQVRSQNKRIAELMARVPEFGDCVRRLESNLTISQEESERMVSEMERLLKG
jgi:predicted ATP-grasp superfamily ATP-dependent carboligase